MQHLALASDLAFDFNTRWVSSLVLRQPIETTAFTSHLVQIHQEPIQRIFARYCFIPFGGEDEFD